MTQPPGPPAPPGPPGPPAPPAQPPQQPAQQPGAGLVHLTIQGSIMTSNVITPKTWVNGYPAQVQYGLNLIPVPPGPVRLDLSNQWLRTYGQASIQFEIQPGQDVPVFYAAPWHQFTTGSIGHQKVKRKGAGAFIGLLAAIIVIVPLVVVLPFILS